MKYAYKTIDSEGNIVCYQGDNPPANYPYIYDSPLSARARIVEGKVIEYVEPEPPAPYVPTPEELKQQHNAPILAEISQLEAKQHRAVREHILGDTTAVQRVTEINSQISILRSQLQ